MVYGNLRLKELCKKSYRSENYPNIVAPEVNIET